MTQLLHCLTMCTQSLTRIFMFIYRKNGLNVHQMSAPCSVIVWLIDIMPGTNCTYLQQQFQLLYSTEHLMLCWRSCYITGDSGTGQSSGNWPPVRPQINDNCIQSHSTHDMVTLSGTYTIIIYTVCEQPSHSTLYPLHSNMRIVY